MASKTKPTLHALLVGIADYQEPASKLTGPVNDVVAVQQYLEEVEATYFELRILPLTDSSATKRAIIDHFQEHLVAPAQAGDSILFYFSGHGTREQADPNRWPGEYDKLLECLLAYDSVTTDEQGNTKTNLLADKELRYLMHQAAATGAHVSAVFDCCFAGDNTRNPKQERYHLPRAKHGGYGAYPMRPVEEFCFWEEVKDRAIIAGQPQPVAEWLPQGRHVQVAASRDREPAYDNTAAKQGAFTESLLDILRLSNGRINYRNLQLRIRNRLWGRFDQRPNVYAATQGTDLFLPFLGKQADCTTAGGSVSYLQQSDKAGHWRIGLGSMKGMREPGTAVEIELAGERVTTAIVEEIRPAYSILGDATGVSAPSLDTSLDPKQFYEGHPQAALIPPMQILVVGEDGAAASTRKLLLDLLKTLPEVALAKNLAAAQYCLRVDGEKTWLSWPGNERMLIRPIQVANPDLEIIWRQYLTHVANWQRILALENPTLQRFAAFPVEVYLAEIDADGKERQMPPGSDHHQLAYRPGEHGVPEAEIVVRLKNKLERPLYVSLLSMGLDFYCGTDMLGPPVVLLENKPVSIYPESGLPGHLRVSPEDYLISDGWPRDTIWLKVIVSTHAASLEEAVADYSLAGLPHPRSMGVGEWSSDKKSRKARYGWATRTIRIDLALR